MTHLRGYDDVFSGLETDSSLDTPLYLQLEAHLRGLIASGVLLHGNSLPPERELAEHVGVSRVTVRKAIERLVRDGLIIQKPGAGTFVVRRFEQPLSVLTGFSEDMLARGCRPASRWLAKTVACANADESMALGIPPHAPVVRMKRLRIVDDEAVAIETAVVSSRDLPSPDLVEDSLYSALRKRGFFAVRALQRLRAGLASPEEISLLNLENPAVVMHIERKGFLPDGRVIEVTYSSYKANCYDFVVELLAP